MIIAYAGWSANQTATELERTLLKNAFNQSIARALNEQKSVAWWDDSVIKITDQAIDLDFVDANFGIFLTETYGHDEVYILNADDRPFTHFGTRERRDPSSFEHRRPALEAVIARGAARRTYEAQQRVPTCSASRKAITASLAGVLQVARWAGHIISVDGQPAVIAALTIVPNVNMSLLKGTPNLLLSITYIDEAFISEIGRSLLLNDLALLSSPARRDGVVSEAFVVDDGVSAGYLSWTTRRPGQVLLTIILPLVALGAIATGLLSMTMLRRLRADLRGARASANRRLVTKPSTMLCPACRTVSTWSRRSKSFLQAADRGDRRAPSLPMSISIASRTSMTR